MVQLWAVYGSWAVLDLLWAASGLKIHEFTTFRKTNRDPHRAENLSVFRKVGTLSTFHFREMNSYDFSFILLFHMYFRHGARATMELWKRLEEQHNWTDSYTQVAWRLKVSNFKLVFLYRFIQFQFHLNYNTSLNFLSKMRSDMLYFYFSDKSNILIILSQQFRYTI